ncbi:ATP-grasp domain-containing protein [Virgibacillus natechei]
MKIKTDERFLPHLKDCLPEHAHGYMSSGYSIALEGWRRGLDLKIKVNYQRRKSKVIEYVLSDKEKSHYFQITRGDLVSRKAVKICVNKDQTKEYLLKESVETPKGDTFDESKTDNEILEFANHAGYPLVIKPTDGTGGAGVIANIKNEKEMKQAITYVRGQLNSKNVIVEQFFQGQDHRLYVVGGEVVGVFKRDPASVTGNGTDTIEKLLEKKNEDRMKIPSLQNKPIKVNSETKELLDRLGYTMKSVPPKGETVFLKSKNNVSSGGEAVDVTDETTDEMKDIAVAATKAIPTLVQAGVDMIIDKENNAGVVLEINSRAHIRTHLFPSYGKARDIPSAIIDYYFPETKGYNRENAARIYFDFDHVFEAFASGTTGYMEIPQIPKEIELTRFLLTADKFPEDFEAWIKTIAVKNKMSGYLKRTKKDNISLIIGGEREDISTFTALLNKKISNSNYSISLVRKVRKTPIMQGFHILDGDEDDKEKDHSLVEENENLRQEIAQLKKRQKKIMNSTSWKVTKPLRALKK